MRVKVTKPRRGRGGRNRQPHYALGRQAEEFRVPPSQARPKRVFILCHYCGYGPDGDVPESGACPKCGRYSWERFALPEPLVPDHMK